ncbi:MAG: GntR family transcriptional regulator [Chloroflexota bacterium]
MPLKPVPLHQLRSVVDITYDALKRAILGGQFEPGEQLVEQKLATQLGVSKTPVRDALARLEREGLVSTIPFRGAFVRETVLDDAVEIFEIRQVLDGMLVRAASQHLTDEELAKAERLLDQADAALVAGQRERAAELGSEFHHLLQSRAGRQRLASIVVNLEEQFKLFRDVSQRAGGRLEKSAHEHRRVLEALKRKDASAAEHAMRDHHRGFLSYLISDEKRGHA